MASYCTLQSSNMEHLSNLIIDLCDTGTKNVSPKICISSSKSRSVFLFSQLIASFYVLCLLFYPILLYCLVLVIFVLGINLCR